MPAVHLASVRSHLLEMLDMREPDDDNDDDNQPPEDMTPVTNLISEFLAMSQTSSSCSIHEACAVNCSNERYTFEPLCIGARKMRLSNSLDDNELTDSDATTPALSPNLSRADRFQHPPLRSPSEWIRLLEISPARLRTDPIVATIRETLLDQAPDFAALSYFWGPPQFDAEIILNGQTLAITSNLAGSLRRYRQQRNKRTGLLWVDAICINQKDIRELSIQVSLMRRIYQRAQMVYIDLGEVDPAWYAGFDLLHRIGFIQEWVRKGNPEQTFSQVSARYGIPPPDNSAWRAYFWLFTMPWFTRTWIVQEAAWATQSEILFGRFAFRWDTLVDSWNFLVRFGLLQPSFADMRLSKGLLGLRDILSVRDKCHAGFSNLLDVMRLTREFETTDTRDRCFAVFSLLQVGPVGQDFAPDYTLSVEEVYQHFAAYLVRKGEGAKLLSYAGLQRRGNILNLSSWAPDWTLQSPSIAPKALLTIRNLPFQAASFVESKMHIVKTVSNAKPILICQGAVVDHIVLLSEAYKLEKDSSKFQEDEKSRAWYQTSLATFQTALERDYLR